MAPNPDGTDHIQDRIEIACDKAVRDAQVHHENWTVPQYASDLTIGSLFSQDDDE